MHSWLYYDKPLLQSLLNTKLRDFYPSLMHLCDDLDIDEQLLLARLAELQLRYDSKTNQIKDIELEKTPS